MNKKPVLFLIMAFYSWFTLNAADTLAEGRRFERRSDISTLVLNVNLGEVRSLLRCGDLCARSSSCKAFCYSQSTALCHLSQPYDPIVQQYNGSGLKCYVPTGCPRSEGYAWYGARCIKGYADEKTYEDARAICTQDGGHLYHFKTLEWDLQPTVDLRTDEVNMASPYLWMGADDLEVQGQYKWSDSSLLEIGSPVWGPNQPDYAYERCMILNDGTNRLHDWDCSRVYKFVCQIDI